MTRRHRQLHACVWLALGPLLIALAFAGFAARKRVPFEGAPRAIEAREASSSAQGEGQP